MSELRELAERRRHLVECLARIPDSDVFARCLLSGHVKQIEQDIAALRARRKIVGERSLPNCPCPVCCDRRSFETMERRKLAPYARAFAAHVASLRSPGSSEGE